MESLHKAKNLEILHDSEHRFIYCNWIGFQNAEMIRRSGQIILALFKEKGYSKLLNDNTLVTGPWLEAANWTSSIWFPDMVAVGLKHFAWIFSPNIFAGLSAQMATPTSDVVKFFNSHDEARAWLISRPDNEDFSGGDKKIL